MSDEKPNNVVTLVPRAKAANMTTELASAAMTEPVPVGDFAGRYVRKQCAAEAQRANSIIDNKVWPFLKKSFVGRDKWAIKSGGAPAIRCFTSEELRAALPDHAIDKIAESVSRFFTDNKIRGAAVSAPSGERGIEGIRIQIRSDVYFGLSTQARRELSSLTHVTPSNPPRIP